MFVYLLRSGQLHKDGKNFFFYEDDIFSSEKKALKNIKSRIDVNNGYCVTNEKVNIGFRGEYLMVTYNCMSSASVGEEAQSMTIRYCLHKIEVK